MAADIGDGDYLAAYRRFFVDFLERVNPEDQLPVKTSGHDVTEEEIVGEIIYTTLQYLDQQVCPPSLQCYIVQLVIDEIKATCRKQPEICGYRQEEKTYAPLKLMQAVTSKVNEICQRYLENSRLALLPPPPSTPMPIATAFAIRNNRRKMEDRHVVLHDLNTIFNIKDDSIASYYAVFDGHAGYHAAVFCAMHLHQYLAKSHHYPTDPELALRDAFLTTDASFIEKSTGQTLSSGTTAVVALILKRKLYIAWVGDSQAAIAQRGVVTQLVNPHKPDRNDERERVEEMGGTVMHRGIWRVNGNLAVSRAIGDAQYKPYVTGDPEIRCITLDGHEDFLIVACDGLWDCVTENEAAELVYRDLCRDPYDYASSSQRLVEYAKNQGSIDNITVIVVFLTHPRQIISRSTHGNPLLADVQMNKMEADNQYLSNANGQQYEMNSAFVKQHSTNANNGKNDDTMRMNDDDDDDYENYDDKSSNGKRHENGDKVVVVVPGAGADYDAEEEDDEDLGPETDVDAVDDVSEPVATLSDVSRQLFTEKPDPSEAYRNDEAMDDDYPSSPNSTKAHDRAVIPETDNVGDSEDSEDEWNYYRIDPNKEEEVAEAEVEASAAGAAGFSDVPEKIENEETDDANVAPALLHEEKKRTIDCQAKAESSKNSEVDSCSDSECERSDVSTNVINDNEISAATTHHAEPPSSSLTKETDSDIDEEAEKFDAQESSKKSEADDEDRESGEEEDTMDFQLNPDAAEFVPVSPTLSMPPRIDLDLPIAGSPLKQTPPMDDIKVPSRREFENEARYRPHEIGEKSCANGRILEDINDEEEVSASVYDKVTDDPSSVVMNLDVSEVSSTKAEFGDESSFLTSEFPRIGITAFDSSYTGSYGEFDDSTIDPMTKSFGPGDFAALGNPVDLNAVHDLTDADVMAEDTREERDDQDTEMNQRNAEVRTEMEKCVEDTNMADRTDDLLDCSPLAQILQSPVQQRAISRSEMREDENSHDYSGLEQPILEPKLCTEPEASSPPPEVQAVTDVTSRLLEMDLEDRGSQDCGFDKCNEQLQEFIKDIETEKDEAAKLSSSLLREENIAEALVRPEELARAEDSKIESVSSSTNDFTKEDTILENNSTSSANIMHNPLDLDTAAPSTTPPDNLVLEDDAFRAFSALQKAPESPDVGLSPLVNPRSQNPFGQMEFVNSCVDPTTESLVNFDVDDVEEATNRLEEENKSQLEEKIPEEEDPLEIINTIERTSPAECEILEFPSENKRDDATLPSKDASLEEKILSEKALEENIFTGLEKLSEVVEAPQPEVVAPQAEVEAPQPEVEAQPEIPATLKLSESLQEFTGLEQQLNPAQVTNGSHATEAPETEVAKEVEKITAEIHEKMSEVASEAKTSEEKVELLEKGSLIAASVGATIAAVGSAAAAKSSKTKVSKVAPKVTTKSSNKSTPTSPTKPAAAAASRLSSAKKTLPAARPTKLEAKSVASTIAKTSVTSTKIISKTASKPAARLSTSAPKPKPTSGTATPKTLAPIDKKPTTNGEAAKTLISTTKTTSASTRLATSAKPVKTSATTTSAAKTSVTSTATSSRPKTAACKTSKTTPTTTTTTTGSARPKTAPASASNLVAKSRLQTVTKSPTTEKQIKDTANKQISSRAAPKTNRTSAPIVATTKRPATKSTSSTNNATPNVPPPIKRPTSRSTKSTANGKLSTTKTTKTKVLENGVSTAESCETTTILTETINTDAAMVEDVPRKDSPVEPTNDNQLITAD